MTNIPSRIEDPSYRYKMPLIQTKVEGKGNGIKTKLVNLEAVAKALRIPPKYILRYVGTECGANCDEKVNTVNGQYRTPDIQQIIDKFIDKYIICGKCNYPETKIVVVGKNKLFSNCAACGAYLPLDDLHKVGRYMLNNPPHAQPKGAKEEGKGRKGRKGKRGQQAEEEEEAITPESDKIQECVDKLKQSSKKAREEISSDVRTLTSHFELGTDLKFYVILKALFADDIVNNIQNAKFSRVMKTYSVRHPQFFILAFSYIFAPDNSLHQWFATIFKYVLDMKLMSEEFLLQWHNGQIQFNQDSILYNKQNMTTLLEQVSPFLDWLEGQEDDEESEEEEDEEDTEAPEEETKAPEQSAKSTQKTEAQLKQEALIAKQLADQQEAAEKVRLEQEEKDKAELARKAAEPRVDLLAAKDEEEDDDFDLDDI